MFLNCLNADRQFGSDLFVGKTFRDQLKHLGFARGQFGASAGWSARSEGFAALVAQSLGNGRAEEGVALMDFPNCFEQVVGRGLLDQDIRRLRRRSGNCRTHRRRKKSAPGLWCWGAPANLAGSFQSVEQRHRNIHYHDVGQALLAIWTAWRPFSASPMTSISSSEESRARRPCRTTVWSSTSRTEILFIGSVTLSASQLSMREPYVVIG